MRTSKDLSTIRLGKPWNSAQIRRFRILFAQILYASPVPYLPGYCIRKGISILQKRIIIQSRIELERDFFVREPFAVISVCNPGARAVKIPLRNHCVGVCRLTFHDVERAHDGLGRTKIPMPAAQAIRVVCWARSYLKRCNILVCQCRTGASIAPAIAKALASWLELYLPRQVAVARCNGHVLRIVEMAIAYQEISESLFWGEEERPCF